MHIDIELQHGMFTGIRLMFIILYTRIHGIVMSSVTLIKLNSKVSPLPEKIHPKKIKLAFSGINFSVLKNNYNI